MSLLFSLLRSISVRKERQIYSEDELKTIELNDKYFRHKHLGDIAAFIVGLFIILVSVAIVFEYLQSTIFHDFIVGQIRENFSAVVVMILTVAGVRLSMPKNNNHE